MRHIGNIGKKIIEVLGIIVLIGIASSYLYHSIQTANANVENLVVVVCLLFFMLGTYGIANRIQEKKVGVVIWIICTIALPRLLILYASGELNPISDSKIYYEIANLLTENGITTIQDFGISEYISMFPYIVFYPFVMHLFLGVAGVSIANMQLCNLLFSIGTGLLLYGLVKQRTEGKSRLAIIAVILWACNPSQFLYVPLLYTEHIFVFLVVALLYVYSKYEKKGQLSKKQIIGYGLGIGLLALGAYEARVAGLIIFIAIVLYEIVRILIQKKPIKESLCVFAIAILALGIGSKLYGAVVVQNLLLPEHKNQPGLSAFTFYIGANADTKGIWNQGDASQILDRVREVGTEQTNNEYWNKVFQERYAIDLWDYIVLQAKKFVIFHEPSHGCIDYMEAYKEIIDTQKFTLATYLFETAMMVILFIKLVKKKQFTSSSSLLLLVFIGNTLFNMLVETSGRYSFIEGMLLTILLVEQWNEDFLKLAEVEGK